MSAGNSRIPFLTGLTRGHAICHRAIQEFHPIRVKVRSYPLVIHKFDLIISVETSAKVSVIFVYCIAQFRLFTLKQG